jgi:hypothetical protein
MRSKKTVAIVQSNFFPWRGYFDFISQVDTFVILDCVQYTRRDWRNRNQIKSPNGTQWISVPVVFTRDNATTIEYTPIYNEEPWQATILGQIRQAYGKAPYFRTYFGEVERLLNGPVATISELNLRCLSWTCEQLGLNTPIVKSSELEDVSGKREDRILSILAKVGATHYITGPKGLQYINSDNFCAADITLIEKQYSYRPYPQQFGDFVDGLSILDLIFNCGPESKSFMEPLVANRIIAPQSSTSEFLEDKKVSLKIQAAR